MIENKRAFRIVAIVFFAVILLIGCIIYDDYTEYEEAQRRHSLVTYQYLNQHLFGRTVKEIEAMGLPDLKDYVSKQYGVTLQLPLVFAEDITDFTMSSRDIYLMRHLYNFLIFYVALIALFFLIKDLFKSEWLALVGTAMMYLFPQFFGSAYFDIKDLLFVSFFIIACFFMVRMLMRQRKIGYCICFAIATALCSGVRILGIVLLFAAMICMLLEDLVRWRTRDVEIAAELELSQKRMPRFVPYMVVFLGTVLFYMAFMPASWSDPVGFLQMVIGKAMDYEAWDKVMPFAGQNIYWDEAPWYYLPVSMGITIPIFNLVMFFVAVGWLIASLFPKKRLLQLVKNRYVWVIFGLFLVPFLFQILAHIKIYLGWRHMYVLYVPVCVLAVYGIQQLHGRLKENKIKVMRFIVPTVTVIALMANAARVAVNHPYQLCMFNAVGIPVADQYYRSGSRAGLQCAEYVLEKYPNRVLTINTPRGTMLLAEEDKKNLFVIEQKKNPDFVFDYYRYTIGNEPYLPGYEEIYYISIDGYKIASILKHWAFDMQGVTEIPMDSFDKPVDDPNREGVQTTGEEGLLLYQPNISLQPGHYTLTVELTLEDNNGIQKIGYVDAQMQGEDEPLTRIKIKVENFAQKNIRDFRLQFFLQQESRVHFRVFMYEGARVKVNKVTIEQIK